MDPSDEELLRHTAAGDDGAFEVFYRRHIGWVTDQAARRCRSVDEVGELCAAVFVSAWGSSAQFDPARGSARAWLGGIVSNRFVDLRRRERRHRALRELVRHERVADADDADRVDARLDSAQAAEPLLRVIRHLPASQLEVVLLVALDGLSLAEVAERLGLKSSTVRMRLARARRSLQSEVALRCQDPGPDLYPSVADSLATTFHSKEPG